jgi:ankyrin repeat protein
VQCHLEHLRTLRTESDIKVALDGLPPGLPATYKAMLDRIARTPRDLKYARTAFMWLIHCHRPMGLNELAVAAVVDPEIQFNEAMRLTTDDDILEICGSFLKGGRGNRIIEFAHFSVHEFLTSAVMPDNSPNDYYVDKESANVLLLKSCFSYLRSSLPVSLLRRFEVERIDKFSVYASLTWPIFARQHRNSSQQVYEFLHGDFFSSWSSIWQASIWRAKFIRKDRMSSFTQISAPNPLYVAVSLSLLSVVKTILDKGASPNQVGGLLSYPIFAAINTEQRNVVVLLNAADVNVKMMDGRTPFRFGFSISPVFAAIDEEVLTMLLRAGADVNLKTTDGRTPLHFAAETGTLPIIRLLVNWQADVTAEHAGLTPLAIALQTLEVPFPREPERKRFVLENLDEMFPLLSNGKEVQFIAKVLAGVIKRDHLNTAKILVQESDPSVLNHQDSDGNTPLHLASLGTIRMAEFLLEAGADDMIENNAGFRPIDIAARAENTPMLKILGRVEDIEPVDYFLNDIDLTFLLDLPRNENATEHVKALMCLSSIYPAEHSWYCHLARACFKLGEHTTAARLWERSYQLNPQNDEVTSIERLAQFTECERCKKPIYGRQWLCMSCCKQVCEPCLKYERVPKVCKMKSHFFIGIPAYSCQIRAESWIEFCDDGHQEVYELLDEALNPEFYYVRDNPPPQFNNRFNERST